MRRRISHSASSIMTSAMIVTSLLTCLLLTCDGFPETRHRRDATSDVVEEVQVVVRQVNDVRYGVLLDGGSSSTKVKVYSYTSSQAPSLVPRVKLEVSKKVAPGFSSLAGPSLSMDHLGEYVKSCLKHAKNVVPEALHGTTPVYMMATAGLRSLSPKDAKALMEAVRDTLEDSAISPFHFREDYVSILSGEEEAVYAWVAANYLHGFFSSSMTREDSVGIMEMGGGSMQIAFLPDGPLLQEEFQVYVGRRRFDLYAQSYLDFGSSYFKDLILWELWKDIKDSPGDKSAINNPCMLKGDNSTYFLAALAAQEGADTPARLFVRGSGDAGQCEEVVKRILLPDPDDPPCAPAPCAIRDRYQPSVEGLQFYAFSAFTYSPGDLKAIRDDGFLDVADLRQKAEDYCKLTLSEAVTQGAREAFASNDCQQGVYIPNLLTTAFGFSESTTSIIARSKINGTSIDWALGAMVQQLSMAFLDQDPSATSIQCTRRETPMLVHTGSSRGSGAAKA